LGGCAKQDAPSDVAEVGAVPEVVDASLSAKERALKAKDELFSRLSSELMSAMSTDGPSAAIEVCSKQAPKIAADVGKEHDVSIGRTSFKLRNKANARPEWAAQFVEQRVAEPQFVELDGDIMGALLPIRLKSQCLLCHGPKDQIASDVRDQLAILYPDDMATGFQEGDLRGWFWVEVANDMEDAE
jgi:hypothetical protein